jgi:colicin import membrane protein
MNRMGLRWPNKRSLVCCAQTGSYQKLHFHPQVDSPVWDLQFARRGAAPLLVSSCTSGSIRAAPAKRLYRAPQNCVEICRLSGQKGSSIEQPFKSLAVSFEKHSVLGTADAASLNTREFCERDAALHRLRLSSNTAGDYPCYLAAGGHAGLVILLELQEVFDTLIPTFFSPPSKKIGRPKKSLTAVGADQLPTTEQTGPVPIAATSTGRKARALGSFATAKGVQSALSKYTKKGKGKARAGPHANGKSFIQADGEVEVEDVIEEEEPEFQEEEEEEDENESDLSLMIGDDSSDGDRISVSEDDVEEEEPPPASVNPEEARLLTEYQLDLSEEDAILLAIQMSEFDEIKPAALPTLAPAPAVESATDAPRQGTAHGRALPSVTVGAKPKPKAKTKTAAKTKATAKPKTGKKRGRSSNTTTNVAEVGIASTDSPQDGMKQPETPAEMKSKPPVPSAPVEEPARPEPPSADATTTAAPTRTEKPKQPKKVPARKATPKTKKGSPVLLEAINQAMAFQAFEYQMGMSEEDALKEALRLSEEGENKRRSSRSKLPTSHSTAEPPLPTPTQPKHTPPTPRAKGASQKKQKKVKEPTKKGGKSAGAPAAEEEQPQRPQTPRRLQFSPLTASEGGDHTEVPAASIDGRQAQASGVPATAPQVEVADSTRATSASPKKPLPKKSPAVKPGTDEEKLTAVVDSEEKKPAAKSRSTAAKTKTPEKKKEEVKLPASAGAAEAAATTPKGKKPAKRSRSTGAKTTADSTTAKKRKKTTTSPRGRQGSSAGEMMSEDDALLLALKMSEIEY